MPSCISANAYRRQLIRIRPSEYGIMDEIYNTVAENGPVLAKSFTHSYYGAYASIMAEQGRLRTAFISNRRWYYVDGQEIPDWACKMSKGWRSTTFFKAWEYVYYHPGATITEIATAAYGHTNGTRHNSMRCIVGDELYFTIDKSHKTHRVYAKVVE